VSGLTVAALADTPKVMTDEDWKLGVFIDAAASDEQAEKLGAAFSGQLGGPMIEDIVPFGVETGEPARIVGIFHPVGSELTVSKATRSQISAFGIEYEGKSASRTRASPGPHSR
jgi:hypothetical protein